MIKHVIIWDYAEGVTFEKNKGDFLEIKKALKALKTKIEGLIEITFEFELLDSSNAGALLNCLFENEEALKQYQVHPEHIKVAEQVKKFFTGRKCIDYSEG